jgi:hypothetical protein
MDAFLSEKAAMDIVLACSRLTPGSIFLVTVDVEPPIRPGTPEEWEEYFREELRQYVPPNMSFARSNLSRANIDIISSIISSATAPREIDFFPLVSFLYRDGHQMLTLGGMFVTGEEKERLLESRVVGAKYVRTDFEANPCEIKVPKLTRKERMFLACSMPCSDGWRPRGFELDDEDVKAYQEIYRFFPMYAELVL